MTQLTASRHPTPVRCPTRRRGSWSTALSGATRARGNSGIAEPQLAGGEPFPVPTVDVADLRFECGRHWRPITRVAWVCMIPPWLLITHVRAWGTWLVETPRICLTPSRTSRVGHSGFRNQSAARVER